MKTDKTKERSEPYVHPSWLAEFISGDRQCSLGLYTQSRFLLPKMDSSFNLEGYKISHQSLLRETTQSFHSQGYQTYVEDENQYTVKTSSGVTISCKPDLVIIRDDEAIVIDTKTGVPSAKHHAQVQLYMATIPGAKLHGIKSMPNGHVVYKNHFFEIDSSEITPEWRSEVTRLMKIASASKAPDAKPSARECRFCKASSICSYKTTKVQAGIIDWL